MTPASDISHLDVLMRAILVRLELASHSAAASTDGNVSHGKNQGGQPPRVSAAFLALRRRYVAARDDDERRAVIEMALEELRSLLWARRLKGHESRELRIKIGMAQDTAGKVAHQFQCSERHVYRCRHEARNLPESVRRLALTCQEPAVDPSRK